MRAAARAGAVRVCRRPTGSERRDAERGVEAVDARRRQLAQVGADAADPRRDRPPRARSSAEASSPVRGVGQGAEVDRRRVRSGPTVEHAGCAAVAPRRPARHDTRSCAVGGGELARRSSADRAQAANATARPARAAGELLPPTAPAAARGTRGSVPSGDEHAAPLQERLTGSGSSAQREPVEAAVSSAYGTRGRARGAADGSARTSTGRHGRGERARPPEEVLRAASSAEPQADRCGRRRAHDPHALERPVTTRDGGSAELLGRGGVLRHGRRDGREQLARARVHATRRGSASASRRAGPRPRPVSGTSATRALVARRAYRRRRPSVADGAAAGTAARAASADGRSTDRRTGRRRIGAGAAYSGVEARLARVALEGKRILITGGAGFIGTTLARRLVDANEIVAVDNLHRDALSGTELAEHPNFEFHRATCSTPGPWASSRAGATHVVHCAAIAGVDTVIKSPVRTMRVNMIGTVQRARGGARERGTRSSGSSTSRRARSSARYAFKVDEDARHDDRLGRRGALDLRGLEARRRAHGARLLRRATGCRALGPAVQHLRPGPDRRRRDPRVHRGARSPATRPRHPRRRLADPRLVLRRRHGRRRCCAASSARGGRAGVQHRQPALGGDDLRPRGADQAAGRLPGRDRVHSRSTTPTSSCGSRTSRRRASCSAGEPQVELDDGLATDDRVVPGTQAGPTYRLSAARRRRRGGAEAARGARERAAHDGPAGGRSRRSSRARAGSSTRSRSRPGRRRSTSRCSRSSSSPATRCSCRRTRSPRRRTSSRSPGAKPVLVDVDPRTMNIDVGG